MKSDVLQDRIEQGGAGDDAQGYAVTQFPCQLALDRVKPGFTLAETALLVDAVFRLGADLLSAHAFAVAP